VTVTVATLLCALYALGTHQGWFDSDKRTCEQAAARYTACIGEVLGPKAAAFAKGREDLGSCAQDKKTVAMYEHCLPTKGCQEFLRCLTDYARRTAPASSVPAEASRKKQCEHHVRNGLRAVALQIVMLSSGRDESSKRSAHNCTLDESHDYNSCLNAQERQQLARYGEQRQRDCESWNEPLARCILGLANASGCNPDEYPMWREPVKLGD